jgi:ribosomal protein S18 acetylase RimI-like enzyme
MPHSHEYQIKTYGNSDVLPAGAEDLFARQLAESRQTLPAHRPDRDRWRFVLVCAVTPAEEVLGGVFLDIGPINGAGPLANCPLAYLECLLVRPQCRQHGLGTELLRRAIQEASHRGCEYIRCSNDWSNAAETALLRKCGFALVDLNAADDQEPCYLAVRPLHNASE